MKVAVCLRGQPRNFSAGFNSINRELISKYNADTFGHAWWDNTKIGQSYLHAPWAPPSNVQPFLDKVLPNLYKFKKFEIEPPIVYPQNKSYRVSESTKPNRQKFIQIILSLYYSQKRVLELLEEYEKENNIDYDWVFLTRYDVGIFKFPDLNSLDRDKIYVSNIHKNRPYIFNDVGILFGKHKYVLKTMFDDFDKNYECIIDLNNEYKKKLNDKELLRTDFLSGESNFSYHFLFNGVIDKIIKYPDLMCNMIREGADPNDPQHLIHMLSL